MTALSKHQEKVQMILKLPPVIKKYMIEETTNIHIKNHLNISAARKGNFK